MNFMNFMLLQGIFPWPVPFGNAASVNPQLPAKVVKNYVYSSQPYSLPVPLNQFETDVFEASHWVEVSIENSSSFDLRRF